MFTTLWLATQSNSAHSPQKQNIGYKTNTSSSHAIRSTVTVTPSVVQRQPSSLHEVPICVTVRGFMVHFGKFMVGFTFFPLWTFAVCLSTAVWAKPVGGKFICFVTRANSFFHSFIQSNVERYSVNKKKLNSDCIHQCSQHELKCELKIIVILSNFKTNVIMLFIYLSNIDHLLSIKLIGC